LAARAVEARAAGLHDALDAACRRELAVAARAALALMLIDLPAMLEIAELAIGLDIIAQGGTARSDRLAQHLGHGAGQSLGPLALHRAGQAARRDAGAEQRLRGIDIADARHHPLIEQRGLDRRPLAG